MLSWRTKNLVPVVAIVLSLFVLGIGNTAHATEECWVDLAVPYGQITVDDAHALINGYVALGGFDFDQDGQPEFIDHNGDGVYNSADVLGIWNEYVHAWINAYYNGCAPVQTEETVPVSGGVVVAEDGGAVVEIPAGALLETTTITVTPLEDGPFTNWGEFEAYEFGPDGTQFQTPVRLSLSYADMGPVDPNTLSIVTYDGGDWVAIPVVDIDYNAQVVIGETTHFSTYALTTAPAAAIGQGCGVAGNQMRLPAWNKDKFLQSNRTCGLNGRGAIVGNCNVDWGEVLWTDEDPTTDDHLSSVHADDVRHRCWWRSGGTNKTGEECEIPVPAPDRTEAAPEDWYNVTNPTESFTCYDLDVCVAGATCDSGTCGLIPVTEIDDERIRVADVSEWTAADLDGSYLKEKYGCVCNEGYDPDGKGGCELRCEPGYKNPGDDVCVLDCPENEAEYGGECILACALDADPDSLCAANEHCDIATPAGIGTCVITNPCEVFSDCGEHGQCDVDEDNAPFCACDDGWTGEFCADAVLGCSSENCVGCSETSGILTCDSCRLGWDGDHCNGCASGYEIVDYESDGIIDECLACAENYQDADADGICCLNGSQGVDCSVPVQGGEVLWEVPLLGTGHLSVDGVALDSERNIIVVGSYSDNFTPYSESFNSNAASKDGYILKVDPQGNYIWSSLIGGAGADYIRNVVVDDDDSIVVGGRFSGTMYVGGEQMASIDGTSDVFFSKFTKHGDHEWNYHVKGTANDYEAHLVVDSDNNIISMGKYDGTIMFETGNTSDGKGVVYIALDGTDGTLDLYKKYDQVDPYADVWVSGITIDNNDNTTIVGEYFQRSISFGSSYQLSMAGGRDVYVASFDSAGNTRWASGFGTAEDERGRNIKIDSDNNVIISGEFDETITFGGGTLSSPGYLYDVFVAKFNSNGGHTWSGSFGGSMEDMPVALAVDMDNNIYVTGGFKDSFWFGGDYLERDGNEYETNDPYDTFVVKYSAGGSQQWGVDYDVAEGFWMARGTAIAADPSGGIVLGSDSSYFMQAERGTLRRIYER